MSKEKLGLTWLAILSTGTVLTLVSGELLKRESVFVGQNSEGRVMNVCPAERAAADLEIEKGFPFTHLKVYDVFCSGEFADGGFKPLGLLANLAFWTGLTYVVSIPIRKKYA